MSDSLTQLSIRQERARQAWQAKQDVDLHVTVGMGTCGLAAGAADALPMIEQEVLQRNLKAVITKVGCVGMCSYEPQIELQAKGGRVSTTARRRRLIYRRSSPRILKVAHSRRQYW